MNYGILVAALIQIESGGDCNAIGNGGPNGWRKSATEKYWAKARAQIEQLKEESK